MVGGSIAGGAVGAAAGTSGAVAGSFAIPMAMAIADVYGEQPDKEKNPLAATGVGMLVGLIDKIGFSKAGLKPTALLTKEGREQVAASIATSKSIPLADARKLLGANIKALGEDYAHLIIATSTRQLAARKGLSDVLLSISKNAGKEAATEALQEAIQYSAVTNMSSLDFDWEDLYKRTREAAVVGGILGGAMHTPTAMYEKSLFNQERNILEGVETKPRTDISMMEQGEINRHGRKLDDIQLAEHLRSYQGPSSTTQQGTDKKLSDFVTPGDEGSMLKDAKGLITHGGAFSSSRDNAIGQLVDFEGGREIAGLLDANSVRGVYSGLSAFKRIHQLANSVMAHLPSRTEKRALFGTENTKDISTIVTDAVNSGVVSAGASSFRNTLNDIGSELADHLVALGGSTAWSPGELRAPDFFVRNQVFDPHLIRINEQEFLDTLTNSWVNQGYAGAAPNQAYFRDLTDRIKDNMGHREISELHKLGVLSNPVFDRFKAKDIEHNTARLVEAIARSAVRNSIFGANGEVLAKGIAKMLDAGEITQVEASQLAIKLQQQMDAFDGRLNRPTSPLIRGVTENLTFASMLVYMDTSLFANLSEVVFGSLGLTPKGVVKYFGLAGKTFAQDLAAKFTQLGSRVTGGAIKGRDEAEMSDALSALNATGHHGKVNDIAFNVGANISTQSKRNMSKLMFKLNGVESLTNAARAARASLASDEINHLVSVVAEVPGDNDVSRWARDRLAYYRMDPDELVDLYRQIGSLTDEAIGEAFDANPTATGKALLERAQKTLTHGIINFVDEFASRPEPGSTAKLLDDQRFALFTQFKKFTWHFSTNVMPQLWKMYIRRGNVQHTYSAYSALMMAFAIAYAGMYLKEAMRGDDGEEKYTDEEKLKRRLKQAFDYSVGQAYTDAYSTATRLLGDTAVTAGGITGDPLSTNPFKPLINQSPSLNLVASTGKDLYGVATKDSDIKEKTSLLKRIPVFGEIPSVRHLFEKEN